MEAESGGVTFGKASLKRTETGRSAGNEHLNKKKKVEREKLKEIIATTQRR